MNTETFVFGGIDTRTVLGVVRIHIGFRVEVRAFYSGSPNYNQSVRASPLKQRGRYGRSAEQVLTRPLSQSRVQLKEGFLMIIREYRDSDAAALRRCVVVLQDSERAIDPLLLPGEEMADRYCERIHARCREAAGQIYVAEEDSVVVGFVTVLGRESFTELDDPPGYYALITDLVVLEQYRCHGIGRQLLEKAEGYAKQSRAAELRIGVLANNGTARGLYLDVGFQPHLEIFIKRW